jgi:phenylpropionate dioxygenase-like ring-hydroxylating dioxygenase large terminal subunit
MRGMALTREVGQTWPDGVPDSLVTAEAYTSRSFAEREAEMLWPTVWQMACREQELERVGDFVTYDVVDDSIIMVRSAPGEIRAYHNVCPHRGRRLTIGGT